MKKIITVFLISLSGFAQNKDINQFKIQISVIPAFSNFNYSGLNNYLKDNDLPLVNSGLIFTPSFSILYKPFSDESFFMNVFVGINTSKSNKNNLEMEQNVIISELGIGKYFIQKNKKYLFAGIALGNVSQNIIITNQNASTTAAVQNIEGALKISSKRNEYVSINTGFDWAIDSKEDILIGIRLSYRIGIKDNDWLINNKNLTDISKTNANGFSLGLVASMR
jgi:outer membrane autotransporter protein